jgi:hypothetical protein
LALVALVVPLVKITVWWGLVLLFPQLHPMAVEQVELLKIMVVTAVLVVVPVVRPRLRF